MKTIFTIIAIFVAFFGLLRLGNALLIHNQATVILSTDLCGGVGGEMKDGVCVVTADLSHDFFTGDPVMRLKNGQVAHLRQQDVLGYSVTSSRYSIGW